MKITRALTLLTATNHLIKASRGGQMVTAGMAGKWANIPYSTSHRYFRDLTKLGLVKRHEYTCKGQKQFHYTLSAEGLALVNSGKELPL